MSRGDGYLAFYARIRPGKVVSTYDLPGGVNVDVDREGRLLGIEIVETFAPKEQP
jgi:uncharacterized protein YuzE